MNGLFSLWQLSVDKSCNLPKYSTTDILVLENLANNYHVALVTVDGQSMCSKTGDMHYRNAAQRELDCLWKTTASYPGTTLRVSKLLGLIEIPDAKRVVGFLEEYIPVSDTWELSTLGHIEAVLRSPKLAGRSGHHKYKRRFVYCTRLESYGAVAVYPTYSSTATLTTRGSLTLVVGGQEVG